MSMAAPYPLSQQDLTRHRVPSSPSPPQPAPVVSSHYRVRVGDRHGASFVILVEANCPGCAIARARQRFPHYPTVVIVPACTADGD